MHLKSLRQIHSCGPSVTVCFPLHKFLLALKATKIENDMIIQEIVVLLRIVCIGEMHYVIRLKIGFNYWYFL